MLVMGLAPVLAPLIGGQLLLVASWRVIFWTLAGFGIASMVAVRLILPETHRGPRSTLHPVTVLRGFIAILRDRSFLWHALTGALATAALLTYIVASPAVLMEHYGVSPQRFGLFFGANAIGLVAAAQLNAHWLRRHTPQQILRVSTAVLLAAGTAVAITATTGIGGLFGIAGAWFWQLTTLGFVSANASAGALKDQGVRAGSASALLGALQFGLGAVSGSICVALTKLHWVPSSLHATGVVTLAMTAAAFAAHRASAGSAGGARKTAA
jgi:DHA1 family bicyclomycin/chloramphenicol resistance-like MFS transporter